MRKWMAVAAVVMLAQSAEAQTRSQWGVSGGFTPSWQFLQPVAELIDMDVAMSGREFEIGVVRGRDLGGDWGISFVRKNVKDGSRAIDLLANCFSDGNGPETCLPTTYTPIGVSAQGVEIHKYVPFVTIKQRVQLGLNLAAGVGKLSGQVEERRPEFDFVFDPSSRVVSTVVTEAVEISDAKKMLGGYSIVPLVKFEAAAAVLVAPGLKLRVSGGVNSPGYRTFGVTTTYLFGGR